MIFHQNVEYNFLLIENRSNFEINRITVFAISEDGVIKKKGNKNDSRRFNGRSKTTN